MSSRQDVQCFDSDDHTCYALAFGVPALLMLVATVILIAGKPLYSMKPPQGNVLTQVCGGIWVSSRPGNSVASTNPNFKNFDLVPINSELN